MSRYREILGEWKFPHLIRGGVTLVSREDAPQLIQRIMSGPYAFYGYEGFTVTDQFIQPHLEWSASWGSNCYLAIPEVIAQIAEAPAEVTHFEFVFDDA
jgi:hypothetical protein